MRHLYVGRNPNSYDQNKVWVYSWLFNSKMNINYKYNY